MSERTKGTWLMSYADLFTLLLTAFLLSVVLINELENSLFMTVDYLLAEGERYLDGAKKEKHIDKNIDGEIKHSSRVHEVCFYQGSFLCF